MVAQPVKVDLTEGTQVILSSGVSAGDQVVIDGQEKLKAYSRVTPRDPNAPAGGGGGRGSRNRGGAGNGGNGAGGNGAGNKAAGNNGTGGA